MKADPEISRRCPSCGVSIRVVGAFCPQCGKAVPQSKTVSEPAGASERTSEIPASETATMNLSAAPTADLVTDHDFPDMGKTLPLEPRMHDEPSHVASSTSALASAKTEMLPRMQAVPRNAIGRARAAGETLGGNVKQSVGKLRDISTVVAEEASYDPSFRFLIVAAVLFILFLVIVIISEVIT